MGDSNNTRLDFDQLLDHAQQHPSGAAANLSLAGFDPTTVGIVLDHAHALSAEGGSYSDAWANLGGDYLERWRSFGIEVSDNTDPETTFGPVALQDHLDLFGHGFPQGIDLTSDSHLLRIRDARHQLGTWFNSSESRPDTDREPSLVNLRPTLFAVSVAGDAPSDTSDLCVWTTERFVTGGIDITLGGLGHAVHTTEKITDTRALQAKPGTATRAYVEATAVVEPTRQYMNGFPTEICGWSTPSDLRISKPLAVGTELLPAQPEPDISAALKRFPPQKDPDPEPPIHRQTGEQHRRFFLTVPFTLGTEKGALGLTLEFGSSWSEEHKLTLPANHGFQLLRLVGVPGTMLVTDDRDNRWS